MGVLRWLDRIDPEKWAAVIELLEKERPLTEQAAATFLRHFGRSVNDDENMIDFEDEDRGAILNRVLEAAVSEETWYLDKALSRGFEEIHKFLPIFLVLNKIIDFEGMKVAAPDWCSSSSGSGLYGCLTPAVSQSCWEVITRYDTISKVTVELRNVKPSLVSRILGKGNAAVELATRLEDDYFEYHWTMLRTALEKTIASGHYLGLGMSL